MCGCDAALLRSCVAVVLLRCGLHVAVGTATVTLLLLTQS